MLILNVAKHRFMLCATSWYDVLVGFLIQYFLQVLQCFDLRLQCFDLTTTMHPIFSYVRTSGW
jgi:hypothetical protein